MRFFSAILLALVLATPVLARPGMICDASGCRPAPKAAVRQSSGTRCRERRVLFPRLHDAAKQMKARVQLFFGR